LCSNGLLHRHEAAPQRSTRHFSGRLPRISAKQMTRMPVLCGIRIWAFEICHPFASKTKTRGRLDQAAFDRQVVGENRALGSRSDRRSQAVPVKTTGSVSARSSGWRTSRPIGAVFVRIWVRSKKLVRSALCSLSRSLGLSGHPMRQSSESPSIRYVAKTRLPLR